MKDLIRRFMEASWKQRIFPVCLAVGVIFLILSNRHSNTSVPEEETVQTDTDPDTYEIRLEQRLEETLSMLKGVGRVKVMITCRDQGKIQVEKDTSYNSSRTVEEDAGGGSRTVTEETRDEEAVYDENSHPFISREESPAVQGVLVLAEGADSSVIQEQLIRSVSVLLDLKASQVQVLPCQ